MASTLSSEPSKPTVQAPSALGSFNIPPDRIIITDVGIGWRNEAFYWLTRGYNICDSNFKELTVYDIERDIDPHGIMDPVCLRRTLWSRLPPAHWVSKRDEPLQPGMDTEMISKISSLVVSGRC